MPELTDEQHKELRQKFVDNQKLKELTELVQELKIKNKILENGADAIQDLLERCLNELEGVGDKSRAAIELIYDLKQCLHKGE